MLILNQSGRRALQAVRAGFTLVELLAVMLIIGILVAFLLPKIPEVIDRAKVTACTSNLNEIGKGLMLHQTKHGSLPTQSGVGFFGALVARQIWEATETSSKKLTCPGVELNALTPSVEKIPMADWYKELDRLDGSWSAYAGRDMKRFPIRKVSGKEVLVADDNDPDGNHRTTTLALFGDYAVRPFEIVDEQEAGRATAEDEFVVVGPDAWIEDLRKLTLD